MSLVFFPCCVTSALADHCHSAAKLLVDELQVKIDLGNGFNCCGYPYKGVDFNASILLSGRNLALAEKKGVDLVATCACCYGTTKQAETILKNDRSLFDYVNDALKREGLAYEGKNTIKHLVEVLLADPGIEKLKDRFGAIFRGLRVAAHYGCHLLRPGEILGFDNPFSPNKFDLLIEATGAESVPWSQKLDCCGAPLMGINDTTSVRLAENKLEKARQAKADLICTACPFCYLQFERTREILARESVVELNLPSLTYVQFLGLALGLDRSSVGVSEIDLALPLQKLDECLQARKGVSRNAIPSSKQESSDSKSTPNL